MIASPAAFTLSWCGHRVGHAYTMPAPSVHAAERPSRPLVVQAHTRETDVMPRREAGASDRGRRGGQPSLPVFSSSPRLSRSSTELSAPAADNGVASCQNSRETTGSMRPRGPQHTGAM